MVNEQDVKEFLNNSKEYHDVKKSIMEKILAKKKHNDEIDLTSEEKFYISLIIKNVDKYIIKDKDLKGLSPIIVAIYNYFKN